MAEIVLGIGCAHTPQLHTLAHDWDIRAERDRADGIPLWFKGEQLRYAELEAQRAAERIDEKLGMVTRQAALDASFAAIDRLHVRFVEVDPDVVVIVGNDQHEMFAGTSPVFTVIAADELPNRPRSAEQNARQAVGIVISDHGHLPAAPITFPGQRALGLHLARHMIDRGGFDVTLCHEKPTVVGEKSLTSGLPHAYGFLYNNLLRDHVKPCVPVDVNCWHFDNTPPARRCYDFGLALGEAIAAWDSNARVAILTTGGLTHFVVDPVWDHWFLDAVARNDREALSSIPQVELMTGTSECKSWIATTAAVSATGLQMKLVDYQLLYRTEGGTGSSCAFVEWR